ncbi:MAG TPA: carbon-nitrogen hydrolase family protein [Candidatus Thermoplasmatota archaeon]|nr:carbon-nitrogen hydrolase family protein [Candidatus Thermoplasmatota archaeon]
MRYKAAVLQFQPTPGNLEANTTKALELLRNAVRDGAKLVVVPELFAWGYDLPKAASSAETVKSGITSFKLQEEAKRRDIWVVGSIAERPEPPNTKPTISAFLAAPEGVSDGVRKIHLWGQEPQYFAPGARTKVLNSRLGRVGPVGCYDLEFPEVARAQAIKGAQLLVAPCAFFAADLFDLVTRARAIENGCWLLAANYIGLSADGKKFCGRSRIVGPDGRVLADAGEKEGYAMTDVDPIQVLDERKKRPYLTELRKFD